MSVGFRGLQAFSGVGLLLVVVLLLSCLVRSGGIDVAELLSFFGCFWGVMFYFHIIWCTLRVFRLGPFGLRM